MPTVHNSARMAHAMHPSQMPPSNAGSVAGSTMSAMSGAAKRVPNLSGRYALFCELGQRMSVALELVWTGFPMMNITGQGHDPTNNQYKASGFWNTETNAFQLTLDLTKLGKTNPKPGRPHTRAFPTISLFGIREPAGIRFSGEAHTCAGLGPFGLMTVRELEARKAAAKSLRKGRGDPKRIAFAMNGGNSNMGSYIGNVRSPPAPAQRAPIPHRASPPPRVGIARPAPQTARPRAATAAPAVMAAYTRQYRNSEYHSQIGYFSQEAKQFRPDASAFGEAHAQSQQAAMAQAQVRARAASGLSSPDQFMRRQQTHTFGEFGDVASSGLEPDHSADGFDDEEFESLLALSPNGPNPARASALAAQRAALESFSLAKEKNEKQKTETTTSTSPSPKAKKSESPKKANNATACYGIGDSEDEEDEGAPQMETKPMMAGRRGKENTNTKKADADEDGDGEPPLPGNDSPRPGWMDAVFDDEDDDHETIEL